MRKLYKVGTLKQMIPKGKKGSENAINAILPTYDTICFFSTNPALPPRFPGTTYATTSPQALGHDENTRDSFTF
jgi:hypothetical protein